MFTYLYTIEFTGVYVPCTRTYINTYIHAYMHTCIQVERSGVFLVDVTESMYDTCARG